MSLILPFIGLPPKRVWSGWYIKPVIVTRGGLSDTRMRPVPDDYILNDYKKNIEAEYYPSYLVLPWTMELYDLS